MKKNLLLLMLLSYFVANAGPNFLTPAQAIPLTYAIYTEPNFQRLKKLVKEDADNAWKNTAILISINNLLPDEPKKYKIQIQILNYLLSIKANPLVELYSRTAFGNAIEKLHFDAVKLLLENGVNPLDNYNNRSYLDFAKSLEFSDDEANKKESIVALLEHHISQSTKPEKEHDFELVI